MSSGLSSQLHLSVANQCRSRSISLLDKWRGRSKSREPSPKQPQCNPRVNSEPDRGRNTAASVRNAYAPSVPPPTLSKTPPVDHTAQAGSTVVAKNNAAGVGSTDMWSAAYREALSGFGDEVASVISKGDKIESLLTNLQETNEELAGDSLFRRGLRRLQAPLKNFKLALDMASPLASIEPTASTAVGVVTCVTAIAIGICGAEDSLNAQIISMLEHVAIIDDCDTLGQKLDADNGIHKALVPVYKDLLSFYIAALEILTSKAFILALVCGQLNQRLPTIISEFLQHAALLRDRIGNATLELVTDIKKLLQDNKIQKLLGVDKYKQRSEVHTQLRRLRAVDACKWIEEEPKFIKWYNATTSSQLVLFGHMGCGKTVITAHVIEELIRMNRNKLPRPLVCYHYCVTDERGKALYIYSSLILQLLDQQEGLKVEFDRWHEKTGKSEGRDPAQSSEDLGNFLSTSVESLDRELFVVIDGLDECDSESQRELIALLTSLSDKAHRLKVFFSSRPQEGIENLLQAAAQIRWNPTLERDTVMVERIVQQSLSEFPPVIQSLVAERLSKLAQGSAIWVRFTIELIKRRQIKAVGPMRKFLADIPSPAGLSQLYAKVFAHQTGDDPTNEQLVTSALEILAVAQRPISILELAWAIALNDPCAEIETLEELKDSVDGERALGLLQPFLPQIDLEDVKKRQVTLVHQSLKELILRHAPCDWGHPQTTAEDIDKQRIRRRQPELQASLLHACVKYLLLSEFDQTDLFSEEQETVQSFDEMAGFAAFDDASDDSGQADSSGAHQGPGNGTDGTENYYDPAERGFGEFFVYSSCFWPDHFKVSAPERLPPTSDIVKLCTAGSKRLQNWTGQNCRPDCTITPKFYNSHPQDPLTIVSVHGPEVALIRLLEDNTIDLGGKEFLFDSVKRSIEQIIWWGDISRLSILFRHARVGPQIRNIGIFHVLMAEWASSDKKSKPWASCFDLIFDICDDVLVQQQWGNELLCLAVSYGCLPMIERLFEEAARNPAMRDELLRDARRDIKPPDYHQSVGEAAWYNRVEVLRYLLNQQGIEAHLQHRDSHGYNVLHRAARWCNPEVVSLLVSHFPEGVNQRNKNGDTPLHLVIFGGQATSGRLESATILLNQGHADVEADSTDEHNGWGEPLRMAARYGDTAMCRVLVEVGGADPRRALKIQDGRPALVDPVEVEELGPKILETLCSLAGIAL
ncbi:hypothetical protein AYL99_06617 [Fonsecaea erecta]|uniref:Nephrocystin 3-like N-terminal domain-containing protein n=1 Tax=Fonsecaea erecta TaxID=1367422 RepID=A0A178ZHN5_9EURO|nr:hypothetical protein AYL99_06617 [Fonsecaea erecta]OAP59319.1 hypothetical protein AYL99_06617 [Fonsecaea erecta]